MIIVLNKGVKSETVNRVIQLVEDQGYMTSHFSSNNQDFVGIIGDTSALDIRNIEAMDDEINDVLRIADPFKLANKKFHPHKSVIQIGKETVGGERLAMMAGPCSVEGEESIISIAKRLKLAGANFLRGGAFKPRTSPYSFQGLGEEGINYMVKAREETGLPIVSELMSPEHIDLFEEKVDVIQIGARNMQNFDLLKAVGKIQTPILLKRGMSATYQEWLMSAEYIMSEGNQNVILCERGIRSFDKETRNVLDVQSVPVLQEKTHLPIIIDPSHAAGKDYIVPAGAKAGIAVGADGLIIEAHENPAKAWSDGAQCLTPDEFDQLMEKIEKIGLIDGRTMPEKSAARIEA